ncbi:hypothetical protein DBR37_01590 [Herminiimonas sp. KBW02]|nr:hypothetical protein DBR37_01590 [Herminiimonas sp. KBW02]
MTRQAISNVFELEKRILTCPQVQMKTLHVLHGGMYSRTIVMPAGILLTGALVKVATLLTICGDVEVLIGEAESMRVSGHVVLPASAGRKQAFRTYAETTITMTFRTDARSIEEAEAEFTDQHDMLMSRRDPKLNTIIITGE